MYFNTEDDSQCTTVARSRTREEQCYRWLSRHLMFRYQQIYSILAAICVYTILYSIMLQHLCLTVNIFKHFGVGLQM